MKAQTKAPTKTSKTVYTPREMAMAMDDIARTEALRIRGLSLLPFLAAIVFLIKYQSFNNIYVVSSVMQAGTLTLYGTLTVRRQFIASVWRGRKTTHRKLYESNKAYFDGRFARYGLREETK